MRHILSGLLSATVVVLTIQGVASAALVHGTTVGNSDLTGSRSSANSDELINDQTDQSKIVDWVFDWEITDNLDSTWHYKYCVTSTRLFDISHFTLEISNGAFDSVANAVMTIDYAGGSVVVDPATIASNDPSINPPNAWAVDPNQILKFNNGVENVLGEDFDETIDKVTYEFDINRVAVWGNAVMKSGQGNVYNVGANNEDNSEKVLNFIAVPDSVIPPPDSDIPEPGTLAIWGLLGLVGLGLVRRRR